MNERLNNPDLLEMAERSFNYTSTVCEYAVWYTDENGKWNEYRVFEDNLDGRDPRNLSEVCIQRLKETMPYRQYKVIKMTEKRSFEFV
ncbi:MAG: hypothetical protein V3S69_00410 [Dehalococcoidales bacterium]